MCKWRRAVPCDHRWATPTWCTVVHACWHTGCLSPTCAHIDARDINCGVWPVVHVYYMPLVRVSPRISVRAQPCIQCDTIELARHDLTCTNAPTHQSCTRTTQMHHFMSPRTVCEVPLASVVLLPARGACHVGNMKPCSSGGPIEGLVCTVHARKRSTSTARNTRVHRPRSHTDWKP